MVEGLVATDPSVGGNTGGYHRQDSWGQMVATWTLPGLWGGGGSRLGQHKSSDILVSEEIEEGRKLIFN